LYFHTFHPPPILPSFPTRRSSDLDDHRKISGLLLRRKKCPAELCLYAEHVKQVGGDRHGADDFRLGAAHQGLVAPIDCPQGVERARLFAPEAEMLDIDWHGRIDVRQWRN